MSTRPKLTDALEARILVWVRGGAFPHMAAAAEGVPQELFEKWLTWGTRKTPRPSARYKRFADEIQRAVGVGRIRAEIALREKDPKTWLLSGPGKETNQSAGWSIAPRPRVPARDAEANSLASPQINALVEALLAALAPFPEARQAVAEAMKGCE